MTELTIPTRVDRPLLVHGDCLDVLARLPAASVDAVLTDPPAGIGFMGRTWDSFGGYEPRTERGREVDRGLAVVGLPAWACGFVAFMTDVWTEIDRVLKPGGVVCAWALPKTSDLATMAMRAVGWTPVDSLLHLFGQGMSKAGDLGKKVDSLMGLEREVVGVSSTCTGPSQCDGMLTSGVSGEPVMLTAPASDLAALWSGWSTQLAPGWEQWQIAVKDADSVSPARLREIIGDHMWTYRKMDKPNVRKVAAKKWGREIPEGAREWRARPLAPGIEGRLELRVGGEVVATMPGPAYSKAPIKSTVANLLVHGCGAMNVDACRTPTTETERESMRVPMALLSGSLHPGGAQGRRGDVFEPNPSGRPSGRLPKNVTITTGGPDCPAVEIDRQSFARGIHPAGGAQPPQAKWSEQSPHPTYNSGVGNGPNGARHGDSGGASRFFTRFETRIGYHAKVSDRSAGVRSDLRNGHATVKSESLTDWLVDLLARPGMVMLDPFMGSGTFGVSAVRKGVRFIGIERDPVPGVKDSNPSFDVAESRIMTAIGSPEYAAAANDHAPVGAQLGLL